MELGLVFILCAVKSLFSTDSNWIAPDLKPIHGYENKSKRYDWAHELSDRLDYCALTLRQQTNQQLNMNGKNWIVLGAVLAAMSVALGAIGAHALEGWVARNFEEAAEQSKRLDNWQVASRYLFYHAIGMLILGACAHRLTPRARTVAGVLMAVGIVLFSGMLYAWVLTGNKTFVRLVPLGGFSFIFSWIAFAVAAAGHKQLADDA